MAVIYDYSNLKQLFDLTIYKFETKNYFNRILLCTKYKHSGCCTATRVLHSAIGTSANKFYYLKHEHKHWNS